MGKVLALGRLGVGAGEDQGGTGTVVASGLSTDAKLSNGDFRFLQSFVQGIDVRQAWDRYMHHRGSGDLRRIRSTVRMQLDVLASTAKRHGDIGTANLFKRDPLRIKASMMSSLDAMTSSPTRMTS